MPAALIGLLRSLFLLFHPWRLLLMLCRRWLLLPLLLYCRGSLFMLCRWRRLLLPLILGCRGTLLTLCRRRLLLLFANCRGALLSRRLDRGRFIMGVFTTLLRRLRTPVRRSALLGRLWLLNRLLLRTFHLRLFLSAALSRRRRSLLFYLLFNMLAHYRVTRLVAVILAAQRLLLFQLWITIS